jgi:hypothetical protein
LANLSMTSSIKHCLLVSSYTAQLYKTQVSYVHPVMEMVGKQSKFEKTDDMFMTQGNLISKFMDFGDACPLTIQDISMVD